MENIENINKTLIRKRNRKRTITEKPKKEKIRNKDISSFGTKIMGRAKEIYATGKSKGMTWREAVSQSAKEFKQNK